jgi:hypothetical protein
MRRARERMRERKEGCDALHIAFNQISAKYFFQCICAASLPSSIISSFPCSLTSDFFLSFFLELYLAHLYFLAFVPILFHLINQSISFLLTYLFCQSYLSIFESFAILFPPILSVSSLFECVSYSFLRLSQISNRLLNTQLSESTFFILFFK